MYNCYCFFLSFDFFNTCLFDFSVAGWRLCGFCRAVHVLIYNSPLLFCVCCVCVCVRSICFFIFCLTYCLKIHTSGVCVFILKTCDHRDCRLKAGGKLYTRQTKLKTEKNHTEKKKNICASYNLVKYCFHTHRSSLWLNWEKFELKLNLKQKKRKKRKKKKRIAHKETANNKKCIITRKEYQIQTKYRTDWVEPVQQ